jgi:hypothetical protein
MTSTEPRSGVRSRRLRIFDRIVVIIGVVAVAILLWKLDAGSVLGTVGRVGWGILFIIAQEVIPQAINAFGWRLSFTPREARSYRLFELWKLWLSMDGINYLIPTGTVAGEVARASMLNDSHPAEVRSASVVASRFGATVAQIAVVLAGFVFLVSRVPRVRSHGWIIMAATSLLVLMALVLLTYLLFGRRWITAGDRLPSPARGPLRAMSRHLRDYFAHHRWRFAASVVVFAGAYSWGAFEGFWICRFIGVPVSVTTALTIEALSLAIDGALFLVPAKIGTQELGKTAIFSLLGLPLPAGLAFGIVRHTREILWALAGFTVYSVSRRMRRSDAVAGVG